MTGIDERLARPLDANTALLRARQLGALADPVRIRILSALASDPTGGHTATRVAGEIGLPVAEVSAHLAHLLLGGIVSSTPGSEEPAFSPTAEAWVLFGRLLTVPVVEQPRMPEPQVSVFELPSGVAAVAQQLAYRYSAYFSRETVERYVADSYRLLEQRAKVTRHLSSLTNRFATDRLSALATAQGFNLTGTPEVLFVCVQNAGRSQIAAAYLRYFAGDHVHVRTAGSQPANAVSEVVLDVLDEVGIPLVAEYPKPLTDEVVRAADVVVTMGCGDACPVYPGRRYLDWRVPDPVGRPLEEARAIRDDIARRVAELAAMLGLGQRGGSRQ